MSDLIKIQHIVTGEEVMIDRRLSRYRRLAMGFLNNLRLNPRFLKHITLTQKIENYSPRYLNSFFGNIRRYYNFVSYIWSVEVQEERKEKYGDSVLHWHIILGFDYDVDFGKEDVLRLQKYWKYGIVQVTPVRKPSISYLMKYISKALDADIANEYQVKRMGSSQIEGWLRQSYKRLVDAIDFITGIGESMSRLADLYWVRGRAYVKIDGRHRICVYKPPSEWIMTGSYSYHEVYSLF